MKNTYSVAKAQANFTRILKEAKKHPIGITRHDETVAFILSRERMDAIIETLEVMANPNAMTQNTVSAADDDDGAPIGDEGIALGQISVTASVNVTDAVAGQTQAWMPTMSPFELIARAVLCLAPETSKVV